jgi:predicted nucleic acid-binding Zn ribbon protein
MWDGGEEYEQESEGATIPCPHCGRQIHEDSQRCPHCGNYLSEEDAPPARKAWWVVVGAILALYAVYRWITG